MRKHIYGHPRMVSARSTSRERSLRAQEGSWNQPQVVLVVVDASRASSRYPRANLGRACQSGGLTMCGRAVHRL